jgi:hypothetical protein
VGKFKLVTRKVLLETKGEPPTSLHQASHTCNNKICVNPDHLLWETPVENMGRKSPERPLAKGYRKRVDRDYPRPYEVRLQRNNRQRIVGYFATEEEARAAYLAAIEKES